MTRLLCSLSLILLVTVMGCEPATPAGDAGSASPDTGSIAPDAGSTTLDSGSTSPDTGSTTPDAAQADAGQSPDTGSTTPDTGSTTPDTGSMTLDTGSMTPDSAQADAGESPDTGGQPTNQPPVVQNQTASTLEDTAVEITFLALDPESDPLSYRTDAPQHGSVVQAAGARFTYTPAADFNGVDSFAFYVSDGVNEVQATVSVTIAAINDPPTASDLPVQCAEDGSVAITLAGQDADGDALSFTLLSSPTHGSLSGTLPHLTYTPAADYNGADAFSFEVSDGRVSSGAHSVNIEVAAQNDAPIAAGGSQGLDEDSSVEFSLPGSDIDGDELTFTVTASPSHGHVTGSGAGPFTYTPDADYSGQDSLTYVANDGSVDSAPASFTFDIAAQNDAPVAVPLGPLATDEDLGLDFQLEGVDVDDSTLSFLVDDSGTSGVVVCSTTGQCHYTPAPNASGTDQFAFGASDGRLTSDPETVTIDISPVNDRPVANALDTTIPEDSVNASVTLTATDADGDDVTFALQSAPAHGTLTGSAPDLLYTPDPDFFGVDSFTFTVSDGTLESTAASVTLHISNVADAPVARAGADLSANAGELAILDGTGSSDADGDRVSYRWSHDGGPAVLLDDATSPRPRFRVPAATVHFQLVVNDGGLDSVADTVTVTGIGYTGATLPLTDNPFKIAELILGPGTPEAVLFEGDILYVGTSTSLFVIDVSDPGAPTEIDQLSGAAYNLALLDDHLLVARGSAGLQVYDAWDPHGLVAERLIATAGAVDDVEVTASCVLVSGLHVLSTLSPAPLLDAASSVDPVIGSSFNASGAKSIAVQGNTVFVGAGTNLYAVDITTLASPALRGTYSSASTILGVAVYGTTAYLAGSAIPVVNVSDLTNMTRLAWVQNDSVPSNALLVSGGRLYVTSNQNGTSVFSLADPVHPSVLGRYPTSGMQHAIDVAGGLAAVVNDSDSLFVFNVASPGSPAGHLPPANLYVEDFLKAFGRVYTDYMSLVTLTTTNPATPAAGPSASGSGHLGRLAAGDALVFAVLPYTDNKMDVFDLTALNAPTRVGSITTMDTPLSLAAAGSVAAVAIGPAGVIFYDASTPGSTSIASIYTPDAGGSSNSVAIRGDRAYVGSSGTDAYDIVDISTITAPVLLATKSGPPATKLSIRDNYLFSRTPMGFAIDDVTDPSSIVNVAHVTTPAEVSDLSVDGPNLDVLLDSGQWWYSYDVSVPSAPRLVQGQSFSRAKKAAVHVQDLIYVGHASSNGLEIVERDALTLDSRDVTLRIGNVDYKGYTVSWVPTLAGETAQVRCQVTAGHCSVDPVQPGATSTTVVWSYPLSPVDCEMVVSVGNQNWFVNVWERVRRTN